MARRPRAAPTRPGFRLHRDGARPHPRLSRRAAAAEGGDRRDRDRGRTRRRRDAHLAFPVSAIISPRTTATRCGSRATSWPIWNGTGRSRPKHRSSRRATTPRNCSASCRWTTSGPSTCARRSRASSTIPISPSSAPITVPPPSAVTPASKARRSASSPTTARSTCPAPTRRRISSRPAASRARRCSISTTPPATWSARPMKRPA